MTEPLFNNKLKQVCLLAIIIFIGILLLMQLSTFIPGILGALTLYMVTRNYFFRLVYTRGWKKGLAASLFVFLSLVIIAIPIYLTVELVSPKVSELIQNKEQVVENIKGFAAKMSAATGISLLSPEKTAEIGRKVSNYIPSLINNTTSVVTNLAMMFFVFYFLLVGGRDMEKTLHTLIPLKEKNKHLLSLETKLMIKSNALGIPVICIIQGIFAAIGYLIFGVDEWALWAFLTGVFAFLPLVGTMIVWVPLVILLYAQGEAGRALGLLLYSLLVTGNVDYLARLTLLKKFGNVHPIITILGVIIGLNLFGFLGLIFGPLLVSYFLVLTKIYINEFTEDQKLEVATETNQEVLTDSSETK
jgi:predicted PurR-regulated permease PerM